MSNYGSLPADEQTLLDRHILRGLRIPGIQLIRNRLGLDIPEALLVFKDRYDYLRAHSADQFTEGHDEYWKDFYSYPPLRLGTDEVSFTLTCRSEVEASGVAAEIRSFLSLSIDHE